MKRKRITDMLCGGESVAAKILIQNISGDYDIEVIPVPIPNTEVKLKCADDICGLPC